MYAPPDSLKSLGLESGGSFSSNSFHSPLLSGCDDPAAMSSTIPARFTAHGAV